MTITRQDSASTLVPRIVIGPRRSFTRGRLLMLALVTIVITIVLAPYIAADVNAREPSQDGLGATALFYAARMGHVDVVTALIKRGADVDARNESQELTALLEASKAGHLDVVTVLMDAGADVNAQDRYGITALYEAAAAGHLEVVTALQERGADVNVASDGGVAVLARTAAAGHLDVVAALLARGAEVNAGSSALAGAAEAGNPELVKLLLERGADVNAPDFQGSTALMYAARAGQMEIVRALLERGADLNATDRYGSNTSLILAAGGGHREVVMALLDGGAAINVRNAEGNTALHEALSRDYPDVARALSERGAEQDSIVRRLRNVDPNNFIGPLLIVVVLLVVGGFFYTRKRLVQRIRTTGATHVLRDRVLIVVVHIIAWAFSTAMYVSAGEDIPRLWGSNSLGAAVLAMLFGAFALFVLFALSLANSMSSHAFVASHRKGRWIVLVVLLVIGFAVSMVMTGDALRGFAVIGKG